MWYTKQFSLQIFLMFPDVRQNGGILLPDSRDIIGIQWKINGIFAWEIHVRFPGIIPETKR